MFDGPSFETMINEAIIGLQNLHALVTEAFRLSNALRLIINTDNMMGESQSDILEYIEMLASHNANIIQMIERLHTLYDTLRGNLGDITSVLDNIRLQGRDFPGITRGEMLQMIFDRITSYEGTNRGMTELLNDSRAWYDEHFTESFSESE